MSDTANHPVIDENKDKRVWIYRILTLAGLVCVIGYFFAPLWWVSLEAVNYPKQSFPDGVKIHFHIDSVRNGCILRQSAEVDEKEALDCVHEMDTINHFVGMFPIASGGPVEKAFSPFMVGLLVVMLLGFAAPGRKSRIVVMVLGFGTVAAWMGHVMYAKDGLMLHSKGYITGMVVSLGQGDEETDEEEELHPLVKRLREEMAEVYAKQQAAQGIKPVPEGPATELDRESLITKLATVYNNDQSKLPEAERIEWNASGMQAMLWHYEKSLGRWFMDPERNDPLVATMTWVAQALFIVILLAMVVITALSWREDKPWFWLLVIIPAIVPFAFIVEYAGWLWWYGHSLSTMGAFTLKPFMPTVFGDGKVAQFTTHSYPHIGFGLMMASFVLLALAGLIRRKIRKDAMAPKTETSVSAGPTIKQA